MEGERCHEFGRLFLGAVGGRVVIRGVRAVCRVRVVGGGGVGGGGVGGGVGVGGSIVGDRIIAGVISRLVSRAISRLIRRAVATLGGLRTLIAGGVVLALLGLDWNQA